MKGAIVKKSTEIKENKNTTYQNMLETAKTVLTGKFTALIHT